MLTGAIWSDCSEFNRQRILCLVVVLAGVVIPSGSIEVSSTTEYHSVSQIQPQILFQIAFLASPPGRRDLLPVVQLQQVVSEPVREPRMSFGKLISELASINASFVQGSVTGPTSFVINISDLKAIILSNILLKYADDIDL